MASCAVVGPHFTTDTRSSGKSPTRQRGPPRNLSTTKRGLNKPPNQGVRRVDFLPVRDPRCSLSARSHSSRPATAQVPLLIVVSPASLCCLLCLPLPFCYAYVRLNAINNTQPSGGCSACDGRSTRHSHGRAAARVDRPKHLSCHVCAWIACMTVTHSHPIIDSRAEWTR